MLMKFIFKYYSFLRFSTITYKWLTLSGLCSPVLSEILLSFKEKYPNLVTFPAIFAKWPYQIISSFNWINWQIITWNNIRSNEFWSFSSVPKTCKLYLSAQNKQPWRKRGLGMNLNITNYEENSVINLRFLYLSEMLHKVH